MGTDAGGGGSGGDAGDGGLSDGEGATGGDTGASSPTCPTGAVTFELNLAPGVAGSTFCLGAPRSCTDFDWLSILTADGGSGISLVRGCVPDCSDCMAAPCPIVCAPITALGDAGARSSWNGAYWQHSTCGPSALSCTNDECAPAGEYIARFCGYPQAPDAGASPTQCLPSATPTCVDVPFVWPPPSGAASVSAVIGGPTVDAGAGE
jgi:hypothetical protein